VETTISCGKYINPENLLSHLSSAVLCTTSDDQLFYFIFTFSYGFQ